MIGACKPTVPLLDYEQVVLSKGIINPDSAVSVEPTLHHRAVTGRCSVVLNDTCTTPPPYQPCPDGVASELRLDPAVLSALMK